MAKPIDHKERLMRDVDIVAQAILDIELVLRVHLESGHGQAAQQIIDRIFMVLDERDAVRAAERLKAGCGLRVVK
jgi:hypothetical protein